MAKTKPVEKLRKHVQNPTNSVDKSQTNSGKLVQKTHHNVQNSSQKVENNQKNVQKVVENSEENSKVSAKNHQINIESTSQHAELTDEKSNRTCKGYTSSNPVMVKIDNIHKSFRLPTERAAGLKQAIFNSLKGIKGYTEHHVLKGISLEVKKGEFIGIVGRNGSGKSTLLKILAQIYYPEQGSIEVNGTLVPFIELGVGFNPELTGRENVYLNGALLGFSRKEMDGMYDEIVHFAELEPFMDAKLKNYSSGMQVRLAFSIAIRAHGDVLILDEVLAVGDAEFQQKCNDYFAGLHGTQTVILVTHSMENVRRFCDRAILIEDGVIKAEGKPDDVAKAYEGLWG